MIASPVDTHGIERQSELSAAASVALSASKVTATAHLAEPDAKEVKRKMKRFAVRMAGVGGIGGLLFGYDLGVVAGALLQLKTHFSLGKTGGGLVVSMLLAGSVCGSLGGGVLTDFYGRKRAILITDVVFIVGSLLIAVAQTIEGVLLGRFIVGVGVSVSAIADVSYLNEMAPKIWRGAIVSVNEMMIAAGFALAAVVDWYFATTDEGWRYMFGGSAILAVAQLLMMLPMPRSPRWLMLKGHEVRCQSAHCTLRNRTKNSVMHGFFSSDYANFSMTGLSVPFISAVGATPRLSYHKNKTASTLALWPAAGAPACLCAQPAAAFGHATGTIKYLPTGEEFGFVNYCQPEPRESVLAQRNPTCDVRSYVGGLQVCKHMWSLLYNM